MKFFEKFFKGKTFGQSNLGRRDSTATDSSYCHSFTNDEELGFWNEFASIWISLQYDKNTDLLGKE